MFPSVAQTFHTLSPTNFHRDYNGQTTNLNILLMGVLIVTFMCSFLSADQIIELIAIWVAMPLVRYFISTESN
jgi:multisubunit Na+/H+ antiporter MnhG subunit